MGSRRFPTSGSCFLARKTPLAAERALADRGAMWEEFPGHSKRDEVRTKSGRLFLPEWASDSGAGRILAPFCVLWRERKEVRSSLPTGERSRRSRAGKEKERGEKGLGEGEVGIRGKARSLPCGSGTSSGRFDSGSDPHGGAFRSVTGVLPACGLSGPRSPGGALRLSSVPSGAPSSLPPHDAVDLPGRSRSPGDGGL